MPPKPPLCPHCSAELTTVGLYNWCGGNFAILSVFCEACRKVLSAQAVPAAFMAVPEMPAIEGAN
jgi:hypothetical protein